MRERIISLIALLIVLSSSLFSQLGTIKGRVFDKKTGETLIGATVVLEGTTKGTITDFDGNFLIPNVKPGNYTILCSFVSFDTRKIDSIAVQADENYEFNFELEEEVTALKEVKVVARKKRESEQFLLAERKNASVAKESIGAQELSRKGAGDVAAGVKKITGVTISNGSNLVVRGMGDRYNSTTLNSLPIASPNPDLKLFQLDIFPTQVVQNIDVEKVFSVKKYADFSGGTIGINTKRFVADPFLTTSISGGFNSQTSFNSLNTSGRSAGFQNSMGFGIKSRQLPSEVKQNEVYQPTNLTRDPFSTPFGFRAAQAPADYGFAITGGKSFKLKNGEIGTLFTIGYDNKYANKEGIYKVLDISGTSIRDMEARNWQYETNLSSLANLSYRNDHTQLRYTFLFLNSSNDNLIENEGEDKNQGFVLRRRITYEQHQMFNNQLSGKHEFSPKFDFNWLGAYSIATSNQPNRMDMKFIDENKQYRLSRENQAVERYYHNLNDKEISGNGNITYKFGESEIQNISFGIQHRYKTRDFHSRVFYYYGKREEYFNVFDPSTIYFSDEDFQSQKVSVREEPRVWSDYFGNMSITSGYVELNYNVNPVIFLNLGLRTEISNQQVKYKVDGDLTYDDYSKANLTSLGLFPALNLKISPNKDNIIRFSASRTITRPEFKEMSPFRYIDLNNDETMGNASIKNAFNYNFDLRYDLFPNRGEILSVATFAKYLDKPIERYIKQSSNRVYSFANTEAAVVSGVEIEIKKNLKSFLPASEIFNKLSVGLNAAYIYSQIDLKNKSELESEGTSLANTNLHRPLQGASPYVINADLNYKLQFTKKRDIIFAIVYNVYGKRIYSFGTNGVQDIYEMPVNTLDAIISAKLSSAVKLKLSAKNLLNPNVRFQQVTNSGSIETVRNYRYGVSYKIGLAISF